MALAACRHYWRHLHIFQWSIHPEQEMNLPILLDPHHRRSCNANPTPCVDYHSNWCEANARQKHLVLSASVTLVLLDPSQQDRYEIAELALHLQRPVVRTEKQVSATTIELRMDQLNKLKHAT